MIESFESFEAALAAAGEGGGCVGGVYLESGEPRYFVYGGDCSDREVAGMAFAVRHGRLMGEAEELLLDVIESTGVPYAVS